MDEIESLKEQVAKLTYATEKMFALEQKVLMAKAVAEDTDEKLSSTKIQLKKLEKQLKEQEDTMERFIEYAMSRLDNQASFIKGVDQKVKSPVSDEVWSKLDELHNNQNYKEVQNYFVELGLTDANFAVLLTQRYGTEPFSYVRRYSEEEMDYLKQSQNTSPEAFHNKFPTRRYRTESALKAQLKKLNTP